MASSLSTAVSAASISSVGLEGEIGGVKFGRNGGSGTLEKVHKEKKEADLKPLYAFPPHALKYSEHIVVSVLEDKFLDVGVCSLW